MASKPVAVLISDVHYNLQNLKLADASMRLAISKANELLVPLIVAGDLHDTKANLRGECVNAMLKTFDLLDKDLMCYILRGNHDAINEKSTEHSIEFLAAPHIPKSDYDNGQVGREVIDKPRFTNEIACNGMSVHLVPYHYNADELRTYLKKVDKGSTIIMHQGLQGSDMGDYFQDKSAINHEDVADFRVISGHYHRRQDIKAGRPQKGAVGLFSYIGNPYTMSYGETNDPSKGFQILMDDGSLEFVSTDLRKHLVLEFDIEGFDIYAHTGVRPKTQDLVWIKIKGTHEELEKIDRGIVSRKLGLTVFKLDLIPLSTKPNTITTGKATAVDIFDSLIDSLQNTSDERKLRLKELYKHLGS